MTINTAANVMPMTVATSMLVLTILRMDSLSPLALYSATYLVTESPNPDSSRFVPATSASTKTNTPYDSVPRVLIRYVTMKI